MATTTQRGLFAVVEGTDGSGKPSVIKALAERFPEAMLTREPGGTPFAEALREVLLSLPEAAHADGCAHLLVHYAARRDHLAREIVPALSEGRLVICDRFAASSWAYNVRGQECAECAELFMPLHRAVVGPHEPDAYLWLDITPQAARARRRQAGTHNHFDERELAFHERVYGGYEEYFSTMFSGTLVRIDATQPLEKVVDEAAAWIRRAWERVQATARRMV